MAAILSSGTSFMTANAVSVTVISGHPASRLPTARLSLRTARAAPCSAWLSHIRSAPQPQQSISSTCRASVADIDRRVDEERIVEGLTAAGITKALISESTAMLLTVPDAAFQIAENTISVVDDAIEQKNRVRLDTKALLRRKLQRQREQSIYKFSAIAASLGISSLAVAAVYYRFVWNMNATGGEFPVAEAAATLLLTLGGAVGMEMWARYAHKALWHDFEPGWALHKSHHVPRIGPFEDNDIFALANAVPAMGLCAYGFITPNVVGGLCFGAGLGITLFGISYMFIHDGLVHKRFPVGPIADVPYLKRVAIAHKLHHSEKYGGVPWGLFLGPHELEQVGGTEELDRMVAEHDLAAKRGR